MKTVLLMHWPLLLGALALQLAYSGAQFAGPELLNQITKYLQTPRQLQVGEPSISYVQGTAVDIIAAAMGPHPCRKLLGAEAAWPCSMPHAASWLLLLMAAQTVSSPS